MGMTQDSNDLGASIRHLRQRQKVTLLQLAERLGCSQSLLSKIERGHIRPTLHMLHRISRELQFEVGAVMSGGTAGAVTIHHQGDRPQLRLGGHDERALPVVLERAIPWREGYILDANLHIIPPGAGSEGFLSHTAEEVGFVIQGTIDLTVDGTTHRLEPGSSFYFDSRLPHRYINVGAEDARIFWVNGFRPPVP